MVHLLGHLHVIHICKSVISLHLFVGPFSFIARGIIKHFLEKVHIPLNLNLLMSYQLVWVTLLPSFCLCDATKNRLPHYVNCAKNCQSSWSISNFSDFGALVSCMYFANPWENRLTLVLDILLLQISLI